jgi:TonB-linked SusC/RagA family outer membrane protein
MLRIAKPLFCTLALLLAASSTALAQTGQITGTITSDDTGAPIPGVNVLVEGTDLGAVTGSGGTYEITGVEPGTYTLTASFVGYGDETEDGVVVEAGEATVVDIMMQQEAAGLDEVVVVGYGEQQRRDLTGAVSSISEEDVERLPTSSPDKVLQGQVSGVRVTNTSGAPGSVARIRIRGGNSILGGNEPLYVVDGFPFYNNNSEASSGVTSAPPRNALATIPPSDIKSIEVLKDASATAIYGARGANGVVLITTKQGREGETNVNFSSNIGFQEARRTLPVMNAKEFARLANEARYQRSLFDDAKETPLYTEEQIESFGKGTNWQEELFRTAPLHNYNLSISGGYDDLKYYTSARYSNQRGIIRNSGLIQMSLRANLRMDISSRLQFGNNLLVSQISGNQAQTGSGGDVRHGSNVNAVGSALGFNPIQPVRGPETGDYTFAAEHVGEVPGADNRMLNYGNPVQYAEVAVNENTTTRILGNFFVKYNILNNLTLQTSFGTDLTSNKANHFVPSSLKVAAGENGRAGVSSKRSVTWLNENTLTYDGDFGPQHSVDVLAGFTAQHFDNELLGTRASGFSTDRLKFNDLTSANVHSPSWTGSSSWSLLSYLGRVNYELQGKYLFTATARMDGSSRFGEGNRWAFFPSGAVAWRLSDEPFMQRLGLVSNLKLRASYGVTGNQAFGNYESYGRLGTNRYIIDGSPVVGFAPTRIPNPDLKWERTHQFDVGIDVAFFNHRLRITGDYYLKRTNDLLLNTRLPMTSGFETATQNVGSLENEGIGLGIEANVLRTGLVWDVGLNVSANRSEVTDLGAEDQRLITIPYNLAGGAPIGVIKEGEPLGNLRAWETNGLYLTEEEAANGPNQSPALGRPNVVGGFRLVDQNGDGVVNSNDLAVIGNALPDFSGGFTSDFIYGNFDLSMLITYSYGRQLYNINKQQMSLTDAWNNGGAFLVDRWSVDNSPEENAQAEWDRAGWPAGRTPTAPLDKFIEDASYLRLSNVTLGYTFPLEQLGLTSVEQARIYVGAQNLFTLTEYSGYDPESEISGQTNVLYGYDYGVYPTAKTYRIGLLVSF